MRRRALRHLRLGLCGLLLAGGLAAGEVSAKVSASLSPTPVNAKDTAVKQRLAEVMASSEFSQEETIRVPKFKETADAKPSEFLGKFQKFMRWVAEILRVGVWVLGAIAVAVLVVTLHYWWRVHDAKVRIAKIAVPTHIGGLDIREASLPDDIAAAAWQRWLQNDAVGCLSLLYRGALSALVLRFGARIRASSTETECVRAASLKLASAAQGYFVELADTWVRLVYAGQRPEAAAVAALCAGFGRHFGKAVSVPQDRPLVAAGEGA